MNPLRHLFLVSIIGASLWPGMEAQAQIDSLWSVWRNSAAPDSARLKAIQALAWKTVFEQPDSGMALAGEQLALATKASDPRGEYEAHTTMAVGASLKSDYGTSLDHLRKCLATAQRMKDRKREANTYSNMSNVYKNLGDLPQALEQLQRSLRIDTELGNKEGLAGTFNNIGNIHTELGDLAAALENYRRSAALAEELNNTRSRAQALLNLGATHLELGSLDTSLVEFERSLALYRAMGRKLEQGMAFNNMGRVYGRLGRIREAFASLDSAEVLLGAIGSMRQVIRTHINRGNLYLDQRRYADAVKACRRAADLSAQHDLLQQVRECQLCLTHAYEGLGDHRRALLAQRAYQSANDSLLEMNDSREVARMEVARTYQERMLADSLTNVQERYARELAHQEQLGAERDRRNLFLFSSMGVLVVAGGLYGRLRYMRRSRAAISRERDRSDELLHNILPHEVAAELKEKGHAEARHFDRVTILFTDFKGFTQASELLSPQELVEELDTCFRAFDGIITARGIEKIKTIGDAYMCAGGLPDPASCTPADVVHAALEMQSFMKARKALRDRDGRPAFEMRVGIHTGPVVAGIVGVTKFQYDIWGDTVNTASRMESSGAAGRVNISESTHALVKNDPAFTFEPRGLVSAKGKGDLHMYFVQAASPGSER
ncbi:MAG TPA: adenylate/guanylate cyclase domain-containing protein [Flavobacteriales bacterium]|nr:adenylate/guanylate cyclase domain-containing protein [Flavobacteriales bacterium]